jgi:hypothetical protein
MEREKFKEKKAISKDIIISEFRIFQIYDHVSKAGSLQPNPDNKLGKFKRKNIE